jgi:hypothetical protein
MRRCANRAYSQAVGMADAVLMIALCEPHP